MPNFSDEQYQAIIKALEERGVRHECPRCGNPNFAVGDGYFINPVQKDFSNFNLGGLSVPSIVLICTKCGFISQHALGSLGFLPSTSINEGEKKS